MDLSVDLGRQILDQTIDKQVAAGNSVWVYGESQSATISSLVMKDLVAANVPESNVHFVLVGDPNFPNGGMLARFPGLTLPSLGITFSGATPDSPYQTTIYNQEYDGFADVPQYPINFISDLNAFFGFYYIHPTYRDLTSEQIANAKNLGTYGTTTYYMVPTADLPLLDPLRAIPLIGTPLADLLQPDLRVLVNLGYGSIDQGWSSGPPNVESPIGLFPDVPVGDVVQALIAGAKEGVQDFVNDINNPQSQTSSSQTSTPSGSTATTPTLLDVFNKLVNTVSDVASLGYSTLLPLADIGNALVTSMPAYDVDLSVNSLNSGKLVDAVGLPIAADTELLTLAAGFGLVAILNQVSAIGADVSDLFSTVLKASPFGAAATAPKPAATGTATVALQEVSAASETPHQRGTGSSSTAGGARASSRVHAGGSAAVRPAAGTSAVSALSVTSGGASKTVGSAKATAKTRARTGS
jgi:hypothetical protein